MKSRLAIQRLCRFCSTVSSEGAAVGAQVTPSEDPVLDEVASRFVVEKKPDNPAYIPWTPTDQLEKRKHYFKRMAFLMTTLEKEQEKAVRAQKSIPHFDKGDIVQLTLRVSENQNKEVEFTGLCIAKRNKSYRSSFTLRKTWPPSLGVERTFPLYCPTIVDIKVIGHKQHKRRKLYYLRETSKATAV